MVTVRLFLLEDLEEVMFESDHLMIMFRVRTAVLKADGGRSEEVIVVIQTEVENSIIFGNITNSCFQFRIPGVRLTRPVTFPLSMAPGVSHSE